MVTRAGGWDGGNQSCGSSKKAPDLETGVDKGNVKHIKVRRGGARGKQIRGEQKNPKGEGEKVNGRNWLEPTGGNEGGARNIPHMCHGGGPREVLTRISGGPGLVKRGSVRKGSPKKAGSNVKKKGRKG